MSDKIEAGGWPTVRTEKLEWRICPFCGSFNVQREHSRNGFTSCNDCEGSVSNKEWDAMLRKVRR